MQKTEISVPGGALDNVPVQWGKFDENGGIVQPDFARWKLCINYSNTPSIKLYSVYFSYDWQWNKYDEREGLRVLYTRLILDRPKQDIRWAKIYMNGSLNISTREKNYNYCIASFKGHMNYLPRFKPVFYTDEKGYTKLQITDTLMAFREMESRKRY